MASPSNPNDQALPPYLMSAIRAGSFTGELLSKNPYQTLSFFATDLTFPPGIGGLVIGGAYGTIYSSTPFLFSIAYGLQCFALGGIYWGQCLNDVEAIRLTGCYRLPRAIDSKNWSAKLSRKGLY
jgi:hypothetical protein